MQVHYEKKKKKKDIFLLLLLTETIRSSSLVCKSFQSTSLAFHWLCDVMQILSTQVTTSFPPSRVYAGSPWRETLPPLVKYHLIFCWWFVLLTSCTAFSYQEVFTLSSHVYSNVSTCSSCFLQSFQVRVLASAWCCWPFLPLAVAVADQIVLSVLDKSTLILLWLPHPVPSSVKLASLALFFFFFSFLLTHSKKGSPACTGGYKGEGRKKHVFPSDWMGREGSELAWLFASKSMLQKTQNIGGKKLKKLSVLLYRSFHFQLNMHLVQNLFFSWAAMMTHLPFTGGIVG